VKTSCRYLNFLKPDKMRDLTHELSSSDRYGEFCHWFQMPLSKVECLADILIKHGYVQPSWLLLRRPEFRERTELLMMSSLYLLGRGADFRSCRILCNISTLDIRHFFFRFLDAFVDMRNEFIKLPENIQELNNVTRYYEAEGLSGACGSMGMVHIKWSNCPSGDSNHAKGKEGYPTLPFQCITDFNSCILGVYGPQFGTFNDKHIVKRRIRM
jgi:hypothetical protein